MSVNRVTIYTDGACSGNPGPGGWAYILRHPGSGQESRDSGNEPVSTNNRMELTAAVRGLSRLKRPTRAPHLRRYPQGSLRRRTTHHQ